MGIYWQQLMKAKRKLVRVRRTTRKELRIFEETEVKMTY